MYETKISFKSFDVSHGLRPAFCAPFLDRDFAGTPCFVASHTDGTRRSAQYGDLFLGLHGFNICPLSTGVTPSRSDAIFREAVQFQ